METHEFNVKRHTDFPDNVYVSPKASVIGSVELEQYASIWDGAVLRADINSIKVGKYSNVQDNSVIHVDFDKPVFIGDYVTLGHNVVVHGATVGNNVLLGIGSIVLDGAVIQDNVILAAGSLVPPGKVLESGFLYMGLPAKKVRKLSQKELVYIKQNALHYVELSAKYLAYDAGVAQLVEQAIRNR